MSAVPQPTRQSDNPIEEAREQARVGLEWLIHPITREQFFQEYWETRPLVIHRQSPEYYNSLLSMDEIDRVLTTLDLRYPNVVLKNAARDVDPAEYTVGGDTLDVARLYQLFSEGSTVTLAFLDTVIPSLTEFCRGMEAEFTHPLQANIYLTPPGNQGAKVHYDTHDVFVLQIAGSKRWTIYGTPVELPLKNQDFEPSKHAPGERTMEFELCAGDVAYIPRGWAHEARSTDTISLHITAGILAYTWTDLLLECVADACLNDPAFRKALPPGFARDNLTNEQTRAIFERLLRRVTERAAPGEILDRFADEFLASCRPLLRGQMAQLAALDRVEINTVVGTRPHVIARVQTDSDSVSVHHFGRKIAFPLHVAPALQFALAHYRFTVRDLPGDLDDAGKLTLVRRLIREGLLLAPPQ
ncbi:MAG: cupin domain-containing protein [Candidatus Acidiferrales bacterium]